MEVKREEMTQEKWDEMSRIAQENVCSVCGADLQIHTVPEDGTVRVGCLNREHHGWVERETFTQGYRRGAGVPLVVEEAIKRKMMPRDELGRAMNLLALRYPSAIKDPATAALFIMDCARLDLDPLIQPAEAVPIPFKSKKIEDGKEVEVVTISMVVTEDGWLSMAARGCKEEWNGPPRTMRLEEYLRTLPENKDKPLEEIDKISRAIKVSACKDENAWYYVAIGRSKTMTEDAVIPGWFTKRDYDKAEKAHLPAYYEPGNQARVRAIKKWVRHVYPEARQKMVDLTTEWYQRAEGIKAAQQFIDAEYSFIRLPEGDEKVGATAGAKQRGVGKTESTNFSSQKGRDKTKKIAAPPIGAEALSPTSITPLVEGEGFSIELTWLKESQGALKWTDDTMLSFLASSPYKVSGKTVIEALGKLTREQAERFTKELDEKVAGVQPQLFD